MAPNAGFLKRSLDYWSYAASAVIQSWRLGRPDVVIATSPQLFAGSGGAMIARLKRRPFVFEVRDLWPESMLATGAGGKGLGYRTLERIAEKLYRRADLIVPVTEPMAKAIEARGVPSSKLRVITHGRSIRAMPEMPPAPMRGGC